VSAPRGPTGQHTKSLAVYISPQLHAELCIEAHECELTLSAYIRGLLSRRGKWARSVSTAGGYDLQAELPPSKRGFDR
jgi:hypothetical protein